MSADHIERLFLHIGARHNAVGQVRPIAPSHEQLGVAKSQLLDDVVLHALRRCGGERVQRGLGEIRAKLSQPAILGSKVVPPVADAVRLVDGKRRHFGLFEQRQRPTGQQSLRRQKQQPKLAPQELLLDLVLHDPIQRAVQRRRRVAARVEPVHLVLHQRDQWAHDHRRPVEQQRRHLIAQALPAPGRHHHQRVSAVQPGPDRPLLMLAERAEPPVFLDHLGD